MSCPINRDISSSPAGTGESRADCAGFAVRLSPSSGRGSPRRCGVCDHISTQSCFREFFYNRIEPKRASWRFFQGGKIAAFLPELLSAPFTRALRNSAKSLSSSEIKHPETKLSKRNSSCPRLSLRVVYTNKEDISH